MDDSEEANRTALQRTFHTDVNLFEYLDLPEHAVQRKQFSRGMAGAVATQPASHILTCE